LDPTVTELPQPRRFRIATVAEEAVHLLMAPRHPLGTRRAVRIAELAQQQWATYPPGSTWHDLLLRACAMTGYVPRIRYLATSEPALSRVLARRDSIALGTPVTAVGGGLYSVPLDVLMTCRRLVVWNTQTVPDAEASDLLAQIRSWHSRTVSADATPGGLVPPSEIASEESLDGRPER
jgi:hypothetical protein